MENSKEIINIEELDSNRRDKIASVLTALGGCVPYIGSIIGEVIGSIIPQQRLDRIVSFMKHLDRKVNEMRDQIDLSKMQKEEYIDLLEDGMFLAARSLTEERRERIASIVKNSLTTEGLRHFEEKKLISILAQLNDPEVLILQSYGIHPNNDTEFHELHKETLYGPLVYNGSSQEEIDSRAIHDTFRQHLVDLGLLRPNFKKPKKGEFPEFDDKTGMIKASGYKLTSLGRLLLKHMDLECWW